jgi:hypothetical protein
MDDYCFAWLSLMKYCLSLLFSWINPLRVTSTEYYCLFRRRNSYLVVTFRKESVLLSRETMTAILLLIFKDTILGFVASIQMSVYDMVRVGDWLCLNMTPMEM